MEIKISPAERVNEIKEYWFAGKMREVARMNMEGQDVVSLGVGGPDRMPSLEVVETLCESAKTPGNHSYQIASGIPALRNAMSNWYKRNYNVTLNPESEILPLIGSKEGVLHVGLAFLNPGDKVLVPNPGYMTYTGVNKMLGAEVIPYNLLADEGWQPDFEQLESIAREGGVKLMWVNYPNMPTGALASRELFEKLIAFGKKHGIVIAHDNPYSFILNDNPMSILEVDGAKEIAIELNSLSKSHNMAGWRMGMVSSNAEFITWIRKMKSNIDSGQFKPIMEAAIKALNVDNDWYKELNSVYASRRKVAEQIMTELGCSFDPEQRGLFLWGKLPEGVGDSASFADKVLKEARVFIVPGFIFGSNGEGYIRISLCATVERMRTALDRVKGLK
ncbi:MAG: aminotransferase class I/II-fold pyridoxal phosphate-dependent enzyme [Muribaculaceae bacterium]|nr:aminotransferase class I/II-fold pyridoxal phosphate-dependent enzyme [Muribaculaceae bacterium]MDE6008816.1 aminotransferase class I/II-fold pyridoxal phosphate-dependent enzyme [Muribaculaceae bacterium]